MAVKDTEQKKNGNTSKEKKRIYNFTESMYCIREVVLTDTGENGTKKRKHIPTSGSILDPSS